MNIAIGGVMNKKHYLKHYYLEHSLINRLLAVSLLMGVPFTAQAEADPKLWPVVKEAFFAKRDIQEVTFLKIDAPRRAESGAQVPVTFSYDKAAANGVNIKKIYVLIDANPIQLASTYHLTEMLGDFQLATRIRFETDSFVRLVGESADGRLYMVKREIRAAGGCGGTVDGDDAAIRAAAGKIKLKVDEPVKIGSAAVTVFNIRHPMRTGLQRDLVSQGFVPAFYINKATFTYNGKTVMTVDVGVGTSEDPYMKFNFVPDAPGKLGVVATDNEGKTFTQEVEVKS